MQCRFLEIALGSEDILASLDFYRALGFADLHTNDPHEYPYAVISDGRLCIGLHAADVDSPALSFVSPGLADSIRQNPPGGFRAVFTRFGEDDFHQAGFVDPDGHLITILEARTFSPPETRVEDASLLGYFEGISLPCRDLVSGAARWEGLGFVAMADPAQAENVLTLTSDGLNVILETRAEPREPSLVFSGPDHEARVALLKQRDIDFELELSGGSGARLRSPEGLAVRLLPDESGLD